MKYIVLLLASLFSITTYSFSQVKGTTPATGESKPVEIIYAEKLRTEKLDSVREVQTGSGGVQAKQGTTLFECDSFYYDKNTKVFEAFGNVHINDNDSINIYSNYLLYHVDTRVANLKRNVRLTDGKSTLTTQQLDYDLNQRIGNYYAGGKVVNENSVLTSTEATYFADSKDVYFKKKVVLVDPAYKLRADSLLYNSETQLTTFITKTFIEDSARNIVTSSGYYDLKNKKAVFGKRPVINDGSSQVVADKIDTNDSTGISLLTGNVFYKDTAQGYAMRGDYMNVNNKEGTLVATRNAVLIIKQDKDSIFVTADTLRSGRLSTLPSTKPAIKDSGRVAGAAVSASPPLAANKDAASINNNIASSSTEAAPANNSPAPANNSAAPANNNAAGINTKTAPANNRTAPSNKNDLSNRTLPSDKGAALAGKDVASTTKGAASVNIDSASGREVPAANTKLKNDSADRYFQAYHRVRIFSDSLQAVSDSLFYSGEDSIFKLFRDPIMWASNSQVSGDTIYIYTKNKKPERVYVFENSITVNNAGTNMFNQLKGSQMNGYFTNGEIDYMRAKGNAESIYYAKDRENYLVGINRVAGDIIDLRFLNKELNRVVVINEVKGTMYPVSQMPETEKRLRNFKWQEDRRPKTKFELFEPPKPSVPVTPATVTRTGTQEP